MRDGNGEKCRNFGSHALHSPVSISLHLIVMICQTRPVIVQKLAIPELPVADSHGSDPSGFL